MSDTRTTNLNTYKMIIRGNSSGQGSSSLCKRLVEDKFNQYEKATIGADFRIKMIDNTRLRIWDTCAQDRFDSILTTFYHGADIFLFCLSAPELLDKSCDLDKINLKIDKIKQQTNCPLILVITKCDTLSKQQRLDLNEKLEHCITNQKLKGFSSHVLCSAFDGSGFDLLTKEILNLLPLTHKEELQIITNKGISSSFASKVGTFFSCCNIKSSNLTELKNQQEISTQNIR
ncbi:MAG: P-loop NTPase family protein [Gammaproteobacteria bacterium]